MKRVIGFCIILLFSFAALAQAQSRQSKKAFRKAARHYRKFDFAKAIPYLHAAINHDPTDPFYPWLLGECLFKSGEPSASLPYLQRAWDQDTTIDPQVGFYLGTALHLNGQYAEARQILQSFLIDATPGSFEYGEATIRIQQCEAALELAKLPPRNFNIENLGEFVNTRFPEYGASFSDNYHTLVFTSRRPKGIRKMINKGIYAEDINEEVFISEQYEGTWMKTRIFSRDISKFTHDAGISLSEDGNTLLYYVDRDSGDIFISRKNEKGKWSRRLSIGDSINSRHHEPSAFISRDGNLLLFVSTRPGGQGNKDIWWSRKAANGEWSAPQNPGGLLNTPLEEDAPFLSHDGKYLYFASRGHNSMGGYDIFRCKWEGNGKVGKPENMGIPLNSPGDDIYYSEREDGKGFYFSSDRPGGYGEQDLYFGSLYTPEEPVASERYPLSGVIMDFETRKPLDAEIRWVDKANESILQKTQTESGTGKFKLDIQTSSLESAQLEVWVKGEEVPETLATVLGKVKGEGKEPVPALVELITDPNGQVEQVTHTQPGEGKYFFPVIPNGNYNIRFSSLGYQTVVRSFTARSPGQITVLNIDLVPGEAGLPVVGSGMEYRIYFGFGKSTIDPEYFPLLTDLVQDLQAHPEWKVEAVGFADPVGSATSNRILSEKRARVIATYLIGQGITANRVSWNGKGEVGQENKNEGNPKDRRVEIYIEKNQ